MPVPPQETTGLPAVSGTYALLLLCRKPCPLKIGRYGILHLQPGYYIYVGSAFGPGGLRARISHHLRIAERPHWHLDYLRPLTEPAEIWFCEESIRQEHLWAQLLNRSRGSRIPMPGFGSSDCRCPTHLFFFRETPSFEGFKRRWRKTGSGRLALHRLVLRNSGSCKSVEVRKPS
jgi:Uri superfamily endonuclease